MNGLIKFTYPLRQQKKEICELNFIKEKHNLMLLGAPGTGKTHLATALGLKACEQGSDVRFYRVADLVGDLEEALKQGTLQRLKKANRKNVTYLF
ncbi:ATP-binding protein [Peribacillus frigoritolerans]|nr:ATP-binding protein [Peribacillus frigoritolerans]